MKFKAALAAGVLALGLTVPALAQDSGFNLSIDSAALATEASAREAYDRLETRIADYCSQFVEAEQCTDQVMTAALEQIGSDMLTRIHAEAVAAESEPVITAAVYETR
ncbi:UrcA family protein [Hyphobacterium marinum]|uniref:UrcA family protein n=1 Tax=Hyphobacterium marinum TaxID=3116574 RepID=A0ABU7LVH6_9PROT|nr:UrcA family protein [Hyphobacterium sp. Y6023]MEE2565262.1 UrcA family protein [Hyphobacterium sp. Y6023]